MKTLKTFQSGVALLHVLPAIALVAAIAFVGGSVYQAEQRKQDAARQAALEESIRKQAELTVKEQSGAEAEEKTVEIPAPLPEEKPAYPTPAKTTTTAKTYPTPESKPKPTYTTVTISSVNVKVEGDTVTVTAALPGTYSGTCGAKVKLLPNYDKYHYTSATFTNSNTCSVTFSKTTLAADGTDWRVFMDFKNSEYTVKGYHSGQDFAL